MKSFRDLFISCSSDDFFQLMAQAEKALPEGWVRDEAAEAHMRDGMLVKRVNFCFTSPPNGPVPTATLFLFEKEPGTFYVSNIVPRVKTELSHDEYNSVLEAFADVVVRPTADRLGITVQVTDNHKSITDYMSADSAELLRRFSVSANKNTGASHPMDRERWLNFITAAHREGSTLDTAMLMRWLTEVESWPHDMADQLAIQYEFGRALLSSYDKGS